jgi:bacillolysin
VYCDGLPVGDDVVGHELTHGVTQNTSNLLYYYQSGAINESLSDVWGEFVDLTNGKGDDSSGVRWLMGEELNSPPIVGALRDMQDPTAFGDPDRMSSGNYWTAPTDSGGVNNKAAYLMTDGGSFNGITVASLRIDKTAKIYYEAQTNLLTSGSDFADLHEALYQGCLNLIGTSGIGYNDCLTVRNATDAVEMDMDPAENPAFSPDPPMCPYSFKPGTILYSNDLETDVSE